MSLYRWSASETSVSYFEMLYKYDTIACFINMHVGVLWLQISVDKDKIPLLGGQYVLGYYSTNLQNLIGLSANFHVSAITISLFYFCSFLFLFHLEKECDIFYRKWHKAQFLRVKINHKYVQSKSHWGHVHLLTSCLHYYYTGHKLNNIHYNEI